MATQDTAGGMDLPLSVIDELLADDVCRTVLRHLHERGEPVPVDDLAVMCVAEQSDGAVSANERRAARTELYQEHLPALTATEVVSFDSMLGTVELRGGPELRQRLEAEEGDHGGTEDK